jgi:osmotically-inducible protein OsmY
MLTREDIGYGPARQYESAPGSEGKMPRERRGVKRSQDELESDLGPYHQRLQRQRRPDPWILADLQEALFLDTWIDADRITVEVRDGEVTLFGTLASRREVGEALKDARKVPGVRKLNNRLEVET